MVVTDPSALLGLFGRSTIGTECWIWPHGKTTAGYGFWRRQYVHRVVYEIAVGPIPEGHQIHHRCRERACFNPSHLEALPGPEHHHKYHRRDPASCPKGHPYPESYRADRRGCKVCNREQQRERARAKRAAAKAEWQERNTRIRELRSSGVARDETAARVGCSVETVRRIDLGLLKRAL